MRLVSIDLPFRGTSSGTNRVLTCLCVKFIIIVDSSWTFDVMDQLCENSSDTREVDFTKFLDVNSGKFIINKILYRYIDILLIKVKDLRSVVIKKGLFYFPAGQTGFTRTRFFIFQRRTPACDTECGH